MKYRISLNFSFELQTYEEYDYEYDDDSDGEPEPTEQRKACWEFEEYLKKKGGIENHVKENDAFDFVENLVVDADLLSAEWHPDEFKLYMTVESDLSPERIRNQLYENSLEDAEYACIGDNGWIVMTRGPNNEDPNTIPIEDFAKLYVYGMTDYRDNTIDIELILDETTPLEVTGKGLELYTEMKRLKEKGITFSQESELKFKVLELLAVNQPGLKSKKEV
jgi:hypothetical protein